MSTEINSVSVVKSGPRTTVQDLGRRGTQRYGVSVSGVLDEEAAILGNRLVDNEYVAAVLECTFGGVALRFESDTRVAVTGAVANVEVIGVPQPMWTTLLVPAGGTLEIGAATVGTHVYIAVAGGIDVPKVLGSRSTHLGTKMGGFRGRALAEGDELVCGPVSDAKSSLIAGTTVTTGFDIGYVGSRAPIRAISGPQYDSFPENGRATFWGSTFRVSTVSDRQGSRLEGPKVEAKDGKHDIISEAAYFGAVQVPSDGQPIVLLADRQSTGGYAKIASVISADLGRMAQLSPGAEVQFEEVDIETAQLAGRERYRWTYTAELTPPDGCDSWDMVCNAADYGVNVKRAGESASGRELWWAAIGDDEDVPIVVE